MHIKEEKKLRICWEFNKKLIVEEFGVKSDTYEVSDKLTCHIWRTTELKRKKSSQSDVLIKSLII